MDAVAPFSLYRAALPWRVSHRRTNDSKQTSRQWWKSSRSTKWNQWMAPTWKWWSDGISGWRFIGTGLACSEEEAGYNAVYWMLCQVSWCCTVSVWLWATDQASCCTYNSDSGKLTFLKETARSPEWLHVTTGKLYHSLSHWMVVTQIFLTNRCSGSVARLHIYSMEVWVCMGIN